MACTLRFHEDSYGSDHPPACPTAALAALATLATLAAALTALTALATAWPTLAALAPFSVCVGHRRLGRL